MNENFENILLEIQKEYFYEHRFAWNFYGVYNSMLMIFGKNFNSNSYISRVIKFESSCQCKNYPEIVNFT